MIFSFFFVSCLANTREIIRELCWVDWFDKAISHVKAHCASANLNFKRGIHRKKESNKKKLVCVYINWRACTFIWRFEFHSAHHAGSMKAHKKYMLHIRERETISTRNIKRGKITFGDLPVCVCGSNNFFLPPPPPLHILYPLLPWKMLCAYPYIDSFHLK